MNYSSFVSSLFVCLFVYLFVCLFSGGLGIRCTHLTLGKARRRQYVQVHCDLLKKIIGSGG